MPMCRILVPVAAALLLAEAARVSAAADEPVDLAAIQQLRSEERNHSKVMDTLFYLTDVNGPRLTNSPNFFAAADWIMRELTSEAIDARKE